MTGDIDQRMPAELLDHMIEKADSGGHIIGTTAVEVHFDDNVGFVCLAGDPANPARRAKAVCRGIAHAQAL